jgi:membrane protein YqaA with SNARE-associated domain
LAVFRFFLTWWGAFLLGALDSSLVFFMPFGIDALVIYLAARDDTFFWLYPLLATAGSVTGAAITYWVGQKAGEVGVERLVAAKRFQKFRGRLKDANAAAMALPALMPPPFPLTPFILTCGALAVDRRWFFTTFAAMRLFRFSAETALARVYGRGILQVLESDGFQRVVIGFIVVAVIGTIVSATMFWRNAAYKPARA